MKTPNAKLRKGDTGREEYGNLRILALELDGLGFKLSLTALWLQASWLTSLCEPSVAFCKMVISVVFSSWVAGKIIFVDTKLTLYK